MSTVADKCPVMGLDSGLPDEGYILHNPQTGLHGCYVHDGMHGLAYFKDAFNAQRFAVRVVDLTGKGVGCLAVTLDEAADVAKKKGPPIVCVMCLDDIQDPRILYVR